MASPFLRRDFVIGNYNITNWIVTSLKVLGLEAGRFDTCINNSKQVPGYFQKHKGPDPQRHLRAQQPLNSMAPRHLRTFQNLGQSSWQNQPGGGWKFRERNFVGKQQFIKMLVF